MSIERVEAAVKRGGQVISGSRKHELFPRSTGSTARFSSSSDRIPRVDFEPERSSRRKPT